MHGKDVGEDGDSSGDSDIGDKKIERKDDPSVTVSLFIDRALMESPTAVTDHPSGEITEPRC